jgi:hypothetical protein
MDTIAFLVYNAGDLRTAESYSTFRSQILPLPLHTTPFTTA